MKAVVMGRGSMSIGVVVVVVAVVAVYRNTEDSIGWIILLVCCTCMLLSVGMLDVTLYWQVYEIRVEA